ncbi:fimbrial protein [Metapseudomonas otitidis]|uniref:fimbrial protein n=1 Tax=Metapseudomonas otitidis TaxID=319939 RepID=UPI0013F63064|nr:fimbrial protein [Pseudomonas otitidis]
MPTLHFIRLAAWLPPLFTSLLALHAQADCQAMTASSRQVPFGAPAISLPASAPIGSVLYEQWLPAPQVTSGDDADQPLSLELIPRPAQSLWQDAQSAEAPVYQTGLPGVGVRYSAPGGAALSTAQGAAVVLQLVKTEPTLQPGALAGDQLPALSLHCGTGEIGRTELSGNLNLVSSTCMATDVDVVLGTFSAALLAQPGDATPWVDFAVRLVNCPPFHGTRRLFDGQAGWQQNDIGIALRPSDGAVDAARGLMRLSPGPDSALGVAIEVHQRFEGQTGPAPLDNRVVRGVLALTDSPGQSYAFPYSARYLRLNEPFNAGIANGALVFTLIYY